MKNVDSKALKVVNKLLENNELDSQDTKTILIKILPKIRFEKDTAHISDGQYLFVPFIFKKAEDPEYVRKVQRNFLTSIERILKKEGYDSVITKTDQRLPNEHGWYYKVRLFKA